MTEVHGSVTLHVNGQPRPVETAPTTMLMHVLRNDLGLKGVRAGCSIGECGACRVILDGESVASCQTPVSEAVDKEVVTPEGLGGPDAPHPVQQAFLDEQAGQCGYCINGMIISVAARLQRDPDTDAEALRQTLDEHLCRCGTHSRILKAACRAAGLPTQGNDDVRVEAPIGTPDPDAEFSVPEAVRAQPDISRWVELDPGGDILIYPGKVELGQGIKTAFQQIVASQLGVPVERVHARATTTDRSPDQGQTSGTFSIEHGGAALAMAARALRRVLVQRAAEKLGVPAAVVDIHAEGAVAEGAGMRLSFSELAALGPVDGEILATDRPDWSAPLLGQPIRRDDFRFKFTGAAAYLQDVTLQGMLHARAVLPPTYSGAPANFDAAAARAMRGVVDVVHDGRLVIVVAEREEQAIRAQERIAARMNWTRDEGIHEKDTERLLRSLPSEEYIRRRDDDVEELLGSGPRSCTASYVKPYQAHGPMSPSAAVAVAEDDGLRIWTHSQGIYPLRREIATFLGLSPDRITVEHVDGPGCYGLNCADDAALLAAIAARSVPGRPVRLHLSIQEEFGWDPYGPGMVGDLTAALDEKGAIRAWRYHLISDSHSTRANGDGNRLLASWLGSKGLQRPWVGLGEPSARNAWPLYDVPSMDVTAQEIRGPLRTGPLRSLGAFFNVFATESFMDELAELAGKDPIAFRLQHLHDERAARVLQIAAERVGWEPHVGPSGRGLGVALARYKDTKAYAAVVAQVEVDSEKAAFRVPRMVVVCDAGTVVNADGLRNQLEGGVIQGLSRTLFEELHLSEEGALERDWTTYPSIGFADIPELDVTLVQQPGCPPLGVGEVTTPHVPAAVANAIDDAIGVRLRRLPFTAANLEMRLVELDEEESSRVLL